MVTNKFIIKDGKETCYGNSLNNNQVKMFVFVVYNKGFLTLELSGFRKLWLLKIKKKQKKTLSCFLNKLLKIYGSWC